MEKLEDIILQKLMNPSDKAGKRCKAANVETVETPYAFNANTCFDDLHLNISVMEKNRTNLAHRHIYSQRKVIGKLIVFCKKVVRKCLKWYINPFAEQQIAFNDGARYAIGRLTQIVTELFGRSQKVKAFQETAEVELDKINDHMTDFITKFDELEREKYEEKAKLAENYQQIKSLCAAVEEQSADQAALYQKIDCIKNQISAHQEEIDRVIFEQIQTKLAEQEDNRSEVASRLEQLNTKLTEQEDNRSEVASRLEQLNTKLTEQEDNQSEVVSRLDSLGAKLAEQDAERQRAKTEAERQMHYLAQRLADLEERMAAGTQQRQREFLPFAEQITNSQSGEDSIVAYVAMVLGYQPKDVTYLDLGANHAKDMSNTYRFYQYGARGVLVEANPELIPELQKYRSEDIILNKCVAEKDGELTDFFVMSGDGLSTKNEHSANSAAEINPHISIKEKLTLETISVNTLMEQYFDQTPVLLNVDLEGCEMEVLPSIDFEKHRPLIIIVETIPYAPHLVVGQKNTEVIDFLNRKGYTEYAFTGINSIFIDRAKLQ